MYEVVITISGVEIQCYLEWKERRRSDVKWSLNPVNLPLLIQQSETEVQRLPRAPLGRYFSVLTYLCLKGRDDNYLGGFHRTTPVSLGFHHLSDDEDPQYSHIDPRLPRTRPRRDLGMIFPLLCSSQTRWWVSSILLSNRYEPCFLDRGLEIPVPSTNGYVEDRGS